VLTGGGTLDGAGQVGRYLYVQKTTQILIFETRLGMMRCKFCASSPYSPY